MTFFDRQVMYILLGEDTQRVGYPSEPFDFEVENMRYKVPEMRKGHALPPNGTVVGFI